MIRIHYLQHVPFEGLGSIVDWIHQQGHGLSQTRLFTSDPLPDLDQIDWLIVMGGPMSIHDHSSNPWLLNEQRYIEQAILQGKIVLGICLGAQLIADVLGARVYPNREKEIGWFPVSRTEQDNPITTGIPDQEPVFHWHSETFELPNGAIQLARNAICEQQAFAFKQRVIGLQFHLETTVASAQALIERCSDELLPAPFIQSAETMLAEPQRFSVINFYMNQLLSHLASYVDLPLPPEPGTF
jgi:GMP synthase-like glutamine amidotransferase